MKSKTRSLRVKQVRSIIGTPRKHRETLKTLGLRRIGHVVELEDTPAVRGAVAKVPYLARVLEAQSEAS